MSALPSQKTDQDAAEAIRQFQLDTSEIQSQAQPIRTRATLYLTTISIIASIVWASVTDIDKVVSARGKLMSTAPSIVLQPLETSILKAIKVRSGDIVKAGQVLAELDPTFSQADLAQTRARLQQAEGQIARLMAEANEQPFQPSAELPGEVRSSQYALWRNRQNQYQSQLQSFDQRIGKVEGTIASNRTLISGYVEQLKKLQEVEGMRRELAASQWGSKIQLNAAIVQRLGVEQQLTNAKATEESSTHELADLKAQRDYFIRQWKTSISQDLIQNQTDRDVYSEQMAKARKKEELVTLIAPSDAIVLEVANRSIGSVISAAEPLMTLTPLNAPLEVVAQVPGSEIGFIRQGDPVSLKLDAYNYMEHGYVEGRIETVSEDSFSAAASPLAAAPGQNLKQSQDTQSQLFYRIRVSIGESKLRNVPDTFRLVPGLPLTADIKVGERKAIAYFLKPLIGTMNEGMREP
jgi:HlyD family type I secretion membrane fusion protein